MRGSGILIRRAHAEEWQALRALRLEALARAPHAFSSTLAHEQALSDNDWRARAALNAGDEKPCFVGEEDGALCGMAVGASGPAPDQAWLMGMYVVEAARGRGLGAALVEAVARWAIRRGNKMLILETNVDNPSAMALYVRCGFQDTGILGPMSSGTGTQTRMTRVL